MKRYDPDIHQRRSIRLRDYDYATGGACFFTVCVQGRECLFGQVMGGEMVLNEAGRMVELWWRKIPEKFGNAGLGEHVIMPDHFHGIVWIVGAGPCARPSLDSDADKRGAHTGAPLPTIVQWFKTMTTNAYIRSVHDNNWPPFPGRLWQRNYYERIIRDDDELQWMREYVAGNPGRWGEDGENPANMENPGQTRGSAPTLNDAWSD
jgi:REP element-mobilizing transposase RayT